MRNVLLLAFTEGGLVCSGVVVDKLTALAPTWVWATVALLCFSGAVAIYWRTVKSYVVSLFSSGKLVTGLDLYGLVPLIEEVVRFKEGSEGLPDPSGVDMERTWRLDARLHDFAILHPDLRPMDGRIGQAAFLAGLLVCVHRGDLERARSLYSGRLDADTACDWEPQP